MYLIISTSTNRKSRSVKLAHLARDFVASQAVEVNLIDLAEYDLPIHDGTRSNDPSVRSIADKIGRSEGMILVLPIYRGDVSIPTRNLIQLGGSSWQRKVMGMISVAGDAISHAATIQLASAMMLEHRVFVMPDFVFAESKNLDAPLGGSKLAEKVNKLTTTLIRVTESLKRA